MSHNKVFVLPQARHEIDRLPGYIRQQVRHAVIGLRDQVDPPGSKRLDYDAGPLRSLCRLRIDRWRVVYLVDGERVYVLAVRKRPPYQYSDLAELVANL